MRDEAKAAPLPTLPHSLRTEADARELNQFEADGKVEREEIEREWEWDGRDQKD